MLFVFDLDGTLLNSKKELSAENISAVQKLHAAGHTIVIATARPPRSIDEKLKKLRVPTDRIYYNGALVRCLDGQTFSNSIQQDVFKALYRRIKEMDSCAIVSIEENDAWYSCDDFDFERAFSVSEGPQKISEDDILLKNPNKLLINGYTSTGYLTEQFGSVCNIIETDAGTLVQIMSKEASKEQALKEIAEKYNSVPEAIYCFGDDHNDIGMFRYCRNSVAMGNAIPELKGIARFVTDSNDNDGVAKFLHEKLLFD